MKALLFLVLSAILFCSCSSIDNGSLEDNRFVVLGPSLVELMYASGLGSRIVGVDRYSSFPEETGNLPQVGGYIDPSLEQIASLAPTSIHISGESPVLMELAATLGIPCYTYRFDTLADVFSSLDSLDARYGAEAADFRGEVQNKLDSLANEMQSTAPISVMIVIYHERGSSSMTVAGRSTFFADILSSVNCSISAPGTGCWPMISAEGVIDLSPDHIISLFPGRTDTAFIAASEENYFEGLGFEPARTHSLFEPYIMIPGGRIGRIAERICSCLL
ncbi:MAG: ABC transporter substrate-binding protein [Candidatus Aegiribacteria sp.]|nr:ABC transporter substrate-binding protein [Candidatus Aegiribacteria sp.]